MENLFVIYHFYFISVRHLSAHSSLLNIFENAIISVWKAALKQQLEEVRDQILEQIHGQ